MSKRNNSTKVANKEHTATAVGRTLQISTKQSIEVCNSIRKMPLEKAKTLLKEVMALKKPIPFKRYTSMGHRKGKLAAGRYPLKTSKEILSLLESAEANAQYKGLSTANLIIKSIIANKAGNQWRYGRQRRRRMKRTNIDIILEERAITKSESKPKQKVDTETKVNTQTKKPEPTPIKPQEEKQK